MTSGFDKLNFNYVNYNFVEMMEMGYDIATNLKDTAEDRGFFWLMNKPMDQEQITQNFGQMKDWSVFTGWTASQGET